MKVHYIGHACLFVETSDLSVIMDPWFGTPAYLNQWHINPQPTADEVLQSADAILISHGHEDHLHFPTLKRCNKQAAVYYPLQILPGAEEFFCSELGFQNFCELRGNKTVSIGADTRITFVPVGHDAIIVLESGGEVLININDSLHAAPLNVIYDTIEWLKKKFPRVDYMFCGYGGASYFPNCVHSEFKKGLEIARLRECLFARNFCVITHELNPKLAVPFAADFLLLHDNLRWINDTRFDSAHMSEFYGHLFHQVPSNPPIVSMKPGEMLSGGRLATSRFKQPKYVSTQMSLTESNAEVAEVVEDYASLIRANLESYRGVVFPFSLSVEGKGSTKYINVEIVERDFIVTTSSVQSADAHLKAEITAANVKHLLSAEWNSDVIIIGYGIEVHILKDEAIDSGLTMLENLLTNYPSSRNNLLRNPLRSFRYLTSNHRFRSRIRRKFAKNVKWRFSDVSRSDWLSRNPGELADELSIPRKYSVALGNDNTA